MITKRKRTLFLGAGLSGLAGYVDVLGFITLKGFFVSFMSGNSTRFAANIPGHGFSYYSALPLALITLFVIGVMIGAIIGHFRHARRAPAILAFVSVMLTLAALCHAAGIDFAAIVFITIAMGAENNIFVREDGEVSVGLTYMTGTLVKVGQKLAGVFLGASKTAWIPYFILWAGLISGAVLGAFSHMFIGLHSLWIAAGFSMILTGLSFFAGLKDVREQGRV